MRFRHFAHTLILFLIVLSLGAPPIAAQSQSDDPVDALMARLTPREKIGQLFLTTFSGPSAAADTDIAGLIREHDVGGVVLLGVSKNFTNSTDTPRQVATLSNELQATAMANPAGIPLFIAIDHEGDGFPYSRLTGGMTPIPNPMAIGATWNTDNAAAVGDIVGRELAALGINLLLGPDVDVLNNPRPSGRGDIGTRTFGGDPWWVAQMGRAYICGVHEGSAGRVATVAKHFPGHGGSDRLPDREIATVDKSLSELRRIELPPFFAVTANESEDDCAVTDAMMTSHIRYRGLQGNIRQFTAPISFDATGLGSILGLPEFAGWRQTGLMVSDALGVSAVAKYFDPTEQNFPHRQIAKEALMAGNDLLIISEFSRPRAAALQATNLIDTIDYFVEEYDRNPLFRQRVEDAAAHVLRVKLRLYSDAFAAQDVVVIPDKASNITGQAAAVIDKIAREAITLLAPANGDLPEPPRRDDDILVFTDAQPVSDCLGPECPVYEPLPLTAVQETITRLYGPEGSGQIDPARINSISFEALKAYLEARLTRTENSDQPQTPDAPDIDGLLAQAEWAIFAMRNAGRDANSDAVKVFLDNSVNQLYRAKLVVLAFNAPYYLDTTEINKLSLYLASYSKMPPFVEVAVRALFGEFVPAGHPPVNVEGISYDLPRALSPDPGRVIALIQTAPGPAETTHTPLKVQLRAGPLIDHNGNHVPDGTEVIVQAIYEGGNQFVPPVSGTTIDGVMEATFTLRQPGAVAFSARSGDATQSYVVRVEAIAPPTVTPSPAPSDTRPKDTTTPSRTPSPEPSNTPLPSPAPTLAPTDLPRSADTTSTGRSEQAPTIGARAGLLLLALMGAGLAGLMGYFLFRMREISVVQRLHWWLVGLCGGMTGYIVYILAVRAWWTLPALASGVAFTATLLLMGGVRGREKRSSAKQR